MYLGYHYIEIKTRDFLKLNFGIWNIVRFLAGFCVKYGSATMNTNIIYTGAYNEQKFANGGTAVKKIKRKKI